jgi:hypothetical protein
VIPVRVGLSAPKPFLPVRGFTDFSSDLCRPLTGLRIFAGRSLVFGSLPAAHWNTLGCALLSFEITHEIYGACSTTNPSHSTANMLIPSGVDVIVR